MSGTAEGVTAAVAQGITGGVVAAFVLVLPVLLGFLGLSAWRRDRVSAGGLLVVAAGFGLVLAAGAIGSATTGAGPVQPPAVLWLWGAGVAGLVLRLARDRRQRYLRTTLESLAVLASGAILLAVLFSLPSILAALARLRAV